MKNILPLLAIAGLSFMTACQSEHKTAAKNDTIPSISDSTATNTQCFLYAKNRDTATLKISIADNKVNGDLAYNLFEKDKNKGKIVGIVKGDTLISDYTFQSEGTTSVRQVVLLKKGDQLIEGFGDIEEVDGKTRFKNMSKLKFENSIVFAKTDCK
jgi:hypothetical protein